jgi:hypothetical protein
MLSPAGFCHSSSKAQSIGFNSARAVTKKHVDPQPSNARAASFWMEKSFLDGKETLLMVQTQPTCSKSS